jgi:hypothetical protein
LVEKDGNIPVTVVTSNRVLILVLSILVLPKERTLDPQHSSGDSLAQAHVEVLFDIGLDTWADEAWFRVGRSELRRDLVRALANLILRTCKINSRNGREQRCDEAMTLDQGRRGKVP